jgi:hypothetical protein
VRWSEFGFDVCLCFFSAFYAPSTPLHTATYGCSEKTWSPAFGTCQMPHAGSFCAHARSPAVAMPFISGMSGFCLSRRFHPRGDDLNAFARDKRSPIFPSQAAIFEHEAVRSGGPRPAAAVESTGSRLQIPLIKGIATNQSTECQSECSRAGQKGRGWPSRDN